MTEASRHVLEAAKRLYEDRWKAQLEAEHWGEIVAVEPESGDYVLGKTFREVDLARQAKFGTKMVYTFRVGGGGAVSIGAGRGDGRLLG
jgi:hypothetical protein